MDIVPSQPGEAPNKEQLFAMNKTYLHNGGTICPICGDSTIVSKDNMNMESGQAWQRIECEYCGARWTDIYKLIKIDDVRIGKVKP